MLRLLRRRQEINPRPVPRLVYCSMTDSARTGRRPSATVRGGRSTPGPPGRFEAAPGIAKALTAGDGLPRRVGRPAGRTLSPELDADTHQIPGELGLDGAAIAAPRRDRVVRPGRGALADGGPRALAPGTSRTGP